MSGNNNPQVTVWGALASNTASPAAQITLHYDDNLGVMTTGRWTATNWREISVTDTSP